MSKKLTSKDIMLPHSEAKVAFYREYLTRFLSIMSVSQIEHVNIFDVFCGRGVYANGGLGSPIQAMETIARVRKDHPSRTEFKLYLNDLVEKHVLGVKEYINEHFTDDLCKVKYLNLPIQRLFEALVPHLYTTDKASKNLVFIDPYGYKDIHRATLYNLMNNGRTEILLFLPISFMHRFTHYAFSGKKDKKAEPLKKFIAEFFEADSPLLKEEAMDVKTYINELARAFSFNGEFYTTSYFIKRDSKNYFALFFITNNLLGLERAIDSMWALDEAEGRGFHEKEDKNQPRLFDEEIFIENKHHEQHEYLKTIFLSLLLKNNLTNCDIYRATLFQGFKTTHATEVFRDLENSGIIQVVRLDGKERRKNSFYINYKEGHDKRFPKIEVSIIK